jgi:hypothetical protein
METLPDNRTTIFNGIEVRWAIGDINSSRAKELGIDVRWDENGKLVKSGPFWEAWGYCMGKMYQLFAFYDTETKLLYDITPLKRIEGQDYYFDQNVYDKLTNGLPS